MVTSYSQTPKPMEMNETNFKALHMHENRKKLCKIFVPDKIMVFDVNDREWFFFFLFVIFTSIKFIFFYAKMYPLDNGQCNYQTTKLRILFGLRCCFVGFLFAAHSTYLTYAVQCYREYDILLFFCFFFPKKNYFRLSRLRYIIYYFVALQKLA